MPLLFWITLNPGCSNNTVEQHERTAMPVLIPQSQSLVAPVVFHTWPYVPVAESYSPSEEAPPYNIGDVTNYGNGYGAYNAYSNGYVPYDNSYGCSNDNGYSEPSSNGMVYSNTCAVCGFSRPAGEVYSNGQPVVVCNGFLPPTPAPVPPPADNPLPGSGLFYLLPGMTEGEMLEPGVNLLATRSVMSDGSDLPQDLPTMRFFYNLGVGMHTSVINLQGQIVMGPIPAPSPAQSPTPEPVQSEDISALVRKLHIAVNHKELHHTNSSSQESSATSTLPPPAEPEVPVDCKCEYEDNEEDDDSSDLSSKSTGTDVIDEVQHEVFHSTPMRGVAHQRPLKNRIANAWMMSALQITDNLTNMLEQY